MYCAWCGRAVALRIDAPDRCLACGGIRFRTANDQTSTKYTLTASDRKFLKSLRILAEKSDDQM
jgi:hypothetical protein